MMSSRKEEIFMVPELRAEREASSLDLQELTAFIDGGALASERRREMFDRVIKDPAFRQDDRYFLTNEEAYDRSTEKAVKYLQICRDEGLTPLDHYFHNAMGEELPTSLHTGMFLPIIEGQGTEEQKKKWATLGREFKILGTYAQTEMGHGTFIRGLETTATYDPASQEFILHTPTLTATKWWPGGLGHTCTHAVVLARLITKGQDHGIHPFIVQLRNLDDHTPMPGVKVGSIGPKFGFFGMDNGFLQLDRVRIPRDQMLMRYSQVAPDGSYSKPPMSKITYGTMVEVRSRLVTHSATGLAKAVTIATRYSVVRRQGEKTPGGFLKHQAPVEFLLAKDPWRHKQVITQTQSSKETQVMDYQTQQFKLLPLIATTIALLKTGQYMMRMYRQCRAEISKGNLESLPELHATSAGLKAFSGEHCNLGIDMCRLACGGHGYSQASGIPYLCVRFAPTNTYEGENTVMYLQTARYLLKLFSQRLPSSHLPENVAYLASDFFVHKYSPVQTAEQFMDPDIQLEAYRQRARRMVTAAAQLYQEVLSGGASQPDAWNSSSVDWVKAAKAHCHYVVLKSFQSVIQSAKLSPNNLTIVQALCALYAVFGITENSGEFSIDGYMSPAQIALAKRQMLSLLRVVRKEAVPLVDAFDYPDEVLNSALGRYDGDVYTHLYNWAQAAPRNKKQVHDVYHKHLRTLLKSKL